jgi:hypothetical protein
MNDMARLLDLSVEASGGFGDADAGQLHRLHARHGDRL